MIFTKNYSDDRTLALAGVVQCAILVHELAQYGKTDEIALKRCIQGLLCQHPDTLTDVTGSPSEMHIGLKHLRILFQIGGHDMQLPMRYLVQMLHLQKLFMKRNDMIDVVAAGIASIAASSTITESSTEDSFEINKAIQALGQLYQNTLSTLSFRIQVHGHHQYLQQPEIANTIRALLFSGVRFALLWQQMGGRKLDFLLAKSAIVQNAEKLLSTR